MSEPAPCGLNGGAALDAIVDDLCADQSERWGRDERIPVETYLYRCPTIRDHADSILSLISNEIALREDCGERVSLAELLFRFPWLSVELQEHFELFELIDAMGGHFESNGSCDTTWVSEHPEAQESTFQTFPGYVVETFLGAGGYGEVYKARQLFPDRLVAIKQIAPEWLDDPKTEQRFLVEIEAAARLRHAHIVRILEVGEIDGRRFFSMDYVEGATLREKLRDGPMPATQAARMMEALADAVQHAHELGVMHRDLKPDNVLIDRAGKAFVTDFGLAKRCDQTTALTSTGQMIGSYPYLAPEQVRGRRKDIGTSVDVYSLGAVLYEMLTGQPLFQARRTADRLKQVLEELPPSPSKLRPSIPEDLEAICLRCLEKSPANRFATAAALRDDLSRFLRSAPSEPGLDSSNRC